MHERNLEDDVPAHVAAKSKRERRDWATLLSFAGLGLAHLLLLTTTVIF